MCGWVNHHPIYVLADGRLPRPHPARRIPCIQPICQKRISQTLIQMLRPLLPPNKEQPANGCQSFWIFVARRIFCQVPVLAGGGWWLVGSAGGCWLVREGSLAGGLGGGFAIRRPIWVFSDQGWRGCGRCGWWRLVAWLDLLHVAGAALKSDHPAKPTPKCLVITNQNIRNLYSTLKEYISMPTSHIYFYRYL